MSRAGREEIPTGSLESGTLPAPRFLGQYLAHRARDCKPSKITRWHAPLSNHNTVREYFWLRRRSDRRDHNGHSSFIGSSPYSGKGVIGGRGVNPPVWVREQQNKRIEVAVAKQAKRRATDATNLRKMQGTYDNSDKTPQLRKSSDLKRERTVEPVSLDAPIFQKPAVIMTRWRKKTLRKGKKSALYW